MPILETAEARPIEAANGRFFNDLDIGPRLESQNLYEFSRDFFGRYSDVLPSEHGLILQTDIDGSNSPLLMQDRSTPKIVSLYFDSRDRYVGVFNWHLTVTDPGWGRTEHKVATSLQATEIRSTSFDSQGRAKEIAPDLTATGFVLRLALDEEVTDKVKKLREIRADREREISRFSVGALSKYSSRLYEKKLKDLQERAENTGFPQTTPSEW